MLNPECLNSEWIDLAKTGVEPHAARFGAKGSSDSGLMPMSDLPVWQGSGKGKKLIGTRI